MLIVGSGLTALDVLVGLEASGHRGTVHIVSRHGRFPEVHAERSTPYDVVPVARRAATLVALAKLSPARARSRARGYDWRAVVDAVRPEGEALWKRLNPHEQRRFDRHLRAIWERHRHRAPQQVDAVRGSVS